MLYPKPVRNQSPNQTHKQYVESFVNLYSVSEWKTLAQNTECFAIMLSRPARAGHASCANKSTRTQDILRPLSFSRMRFTRLVPPECCRISFQNLTLPRSERTKKPKMSWHGVSRSALATARLPTSALIMTLGSACHGGAHNNNYN